MRTPTHEDWERAMAKRNAAAVSAARYLIWHEDEKARQYAEEAIAYDDEMTRISIVLDGDGS
jgi:hypothetical protein